MKSKAIFMALLALAFGAQAVPVSRQDVTAAAQAWARSGTAMGLRVGSRVIRTDTVVVTNDLAFYVVSLDGGTIVMSGDDDLNPVVMFSSNANLDLSDGSPLVDLLTMDGKVRSALHRQSIDRTVLRSTAGTSGNVASSPSSRVANRIWRALIDAGKSETDLRATSAGAGGSVDPVSSVDDVRVAPLVDSKWDQTTDRNGRPLYNYYTPEGYIYGGNYPCGCTATALAQIMRKYRYPTAEVEQKKRMCSIENESLEKTTRGGVFKWDDMPANPNVSNTDVQREAVGHLTYDVAVLLRTAWSNAGGGGARLMDTANVLVSDFGYANAFVYSDYSMDPTSSDPGSWKGGLHDLAVREKTIYANLDAGRPVELGIHGFQKGHIGEFPSYWAGHAVIGDGYGFKSINGEKTAFVHINMGWSGLDDLWYNIPEINAANSGAHVGDSGYDFCYMAAVLFNISPTETGDLLTGRVVDMDEAPMDRAIVEAWHDGEVVATTETDEHGIYAFTLAGGKDKQYEIVAASADGSMKSEALTVTLSKTTADSSGHNIESRSNIGNSWGNDLMLEEVVFENSVKNANTGSFYGTLDAALAEASADDTLEILSTTLLRTSQTIDKNLTIRTADGVSPADAPVNCRTAAVHGFTSVTNGATLALENVVFNGTKGCFVYVHSNAFLSVAGTIGLSDGSYIHTEDEKGIRLTGELASFLTVDCLVSTGAGQQFGTCSDEAFAASAANFLNPYDEDLGGVVSGSKLVWSRVPIDPSIAIAYFTGDAGENKQYYRKLGTLFDDHQEDSGDIVILKDCELKLPAFVRGTKHLICTNEADAATITFATDTNATFYVEAGASLSVSNLVFTGATGDGAFVVNGGELTLEAGAGISDCVNERNYYDYSGAGGVSVFSGRLTMKSGVVIDGCITDYGMGGGIFVDWEGEADLQGGVVTNCLAGLYGGGVGVYMFGSIQVAGDLSIWRNKASGWEDGRDVSDNLYLMAGNQMDQMTPTMTLTGELTGMIGLRCEGQMDDGLVGEQFGLIADSFVDETAVSNSAALFRSDDNPDKWHGAVATAEDGSRILVWSDEVIPVPVPEPEDKAVRVIYEPDGGIATTNVYDTLDKAFASLQGDATVEICADHAELWMSNTVELAWSVVLKTEDNDDELISKINRPGNASIIVNKNASLCLTNVWLSGGSAVMVEVVGGELTMAAGSTVSGVKSSGSRDACGVSVYEGEFTMKDGAEVHGCTNGFVSVEKSQTAPAGGVIVEGKGAVFNMEGGTVRDCAGVLGGGVFIGNEARMNVSGAPRIYDNHLLAGGTVTETNANLSVSNESTDGRTGQLYLTGEFTGTIGVLEPRLYLSYDVQPGVDTNVFGRVDREAGDLTNLVSSAKLFYRDADSDVTGLVVTNADPAAEALLVWKSAVDEDGIYRDKDGNEYKVVEGPTPTPTEIDPPTAVTGLVYNGNEQTGVVAADGYTVTDNVKINAGDYTATVTLKDGYVWTGGSTDPLQIGWSIAKTTYDMSGVTFEGASFEADGSPKSIYISGDLPAGVSVSYEGNGQTAPGSYTVTAKFTGDAVNYEPIDDMTATLTITKKQDPDPDPPQWDVITNHPTPIAFQSIDRVSDTEWKLTVTNRVEYCNYRLIWTTDLTKGFTSTGAWEHAVGPAAAPTWTTNVLTTGGAWFWRAEGADGTNMVPHQAEGK